MERFNKILIIIRRSNGDVFLTEPLIRNLKEFYNAKIDLLINADTLAIAKTIPFVNNIYLYDYTRKGFSKILNETKLFWKIFKKYDLAISLTANDRSVRYAIFSARRSISVIEKEAKKSWWKKYLLTSYFYSEDKPVVQQYMIPLKILGYEVNKIYVNTYYNKDLFSELQNRYRFLNDKYIIFHPAALYEYKIYPQHLRNRLLELLNTLNIPIIITGGKSPVDMKISSTIPKLTNVYNLIGKTSLEEYIALSDNCEAYVGMDTLNMHIAAAQNKPVFTIFGPTLHKIWSPWSNLCQTNAQDNPPYQKYCNIHIFQADMECVPCGRAGCDDNHGKSECLYNIDPEFIFTRLKNEIAR